MPGKGGNKGKTNKEGGEKKKLVFFQKKNMLVFCCELPEVSTVFSVMEKRKNITGFLFFWEGERKRRRGEKKLLTEKSNYSL